VDGGGADDGGEGGERRRRDPGESGGSRRSSATTAGAATGRPVSTVRFMGLVVGVIFCFLCGYAETNKKMRER
jgi:hypothetical protein